MQNRKPLWMMIGSMTIFGTIGLFRRFIPLGSATLAMLRGGIGMISLLVILLFKRQKLSWADIRKKAVLLLISGILLGANWILLFEAYNYTTVAVATLCYYMAPIFILIASPFLFKEKLTPRKLLCIAMALLGMVFVSGVLHPAEGAGDFRGILLGLCAALLYAAIVILNKKLQGVSAYERTVSQLGVAAATLLPYVLLTETVDRAALTPGAIVMVLVVGLVHTGLAYAMYFGSMGSLPAQTVALFSYIDPVVAILLSAFVLSEPMGVGEWIGVVLVLFAAVFSELNGKKAG